MCIRDGLAGEGIDFFCRSYPGRIAARYEVDESGKNYEVLAAIAIARKCLQKGGEPDIDKAASMFLDDLRGGRLGRISLEWPEEKEASLEDAETGNTNEKERTSGAKTE